MFYTWIAYLALVTLGCARVQVEAPKDPIKMDISMRLDVFQHVSKDIDAIENIVSGKDPGKTNLADLLVRPAYADDLPPEVREAALRRKERRSQVHTLLSQGALGESHSGLLTVRGQDGSAQGLANEENADRMAIYQALASKNGTSVEDVQKLYAEKLRGYAPAGSPVETPDGQWRNK